MVDLRVSSILERQAMREVGVDRGLGEIRAGATISGDVKESVRATLADSGD